MSWAAGCTRPSPWVTSPDNLKEYVYFPGRGEDCQHPKLYELVVEKDNVVYRLRVNH